MTPLLKLLIFIFLFTIFSSSTYAHENHNHSSSNLHNKLKQQATQYSEGPESSIEQNSTFNTSQQYDISYDVGGQFSDIFYNWQDPSVGVLAVHATLLPNGKVLAWDATPDDWDFNPHSNRTNITRVALWSPGLYFNDQGYLERTDNRDADGKEGTDLFCSGSSHLWDGRIIFTGGDTGVGDHGENGPSRHTNIYDYKINVWNRIADMNVDRWYPTNATLSSGRTLTYAGTYSPDPFAEVLDFNKFWRSLNIGPYFNPTTGDYQGVQTADVNDENDVVYVFLPHVDILKVDAKDTGSQAKYLRRDEEYRSYGSYAMFDAVKGQVLVAGGGNVDGRPAYDSSLVIHLKEKWIENTLPLTYRRRQHNMTVLADQSVLATGGHATDNQLVSKDHAVNHAELWNPETRSWKVLNPMKVSRQYHSIALLLPDATVLLSGGGYCGECSAEGYLEQNAEIFYPPYLFKNNQLSQDRPQILYPNENKINPNKHYHFNYNKIYTIESDQNTRIKKVTLVKLGSVTHSTNQEQRAMKLNHWLEGSQLKIQSPQNRRIAPPGHYMLFVINDQGVPSIAEIVKVGQPLLDNGSQVVDRLHFQDEQIYEINMQNYQGLIINNSNPNIQLTATIGEYPNVAGYNDCLNIDETNCRLNAPPNSTVYILATSYNLPGNYLDFNFTVTLTPHFVDQSNVMPPIFDSNPNDLSKIEIGLNFLYDKVVWQVTGFLDDGAPTYCKHPNNDVLMFEDVPQAETLGLATNDIWNTSGICEDISIDQNTLPKTDFPPEQVGRVFIYDGRHFLVTPETDKDRHCLLMDSELILSRGVAEINLDNFEAKWNENDCRPSEINDTSF